MGGSDRQRGCATDQELQDQTSGRDDRPDSRRVPLWDRRGQLTMSLLWVTMVTAFPTFLVGVDWFRQGISFQQLCMNVVLGCLALLAYYLPICALASQTGLSFKMLSREVFGSHGNRLLLPILLFIVCGWYSVDTLLMADLISGLFGLKSYFVVLAVVFAFAMAFNNFFGFRGIAVFAKYVAGPVLITWILYSLLKVAPTVPLSAICAPAKMEFQPACIAISSFVIGFAVWGNEADYWRHSKPGIISISFALFLALLIGEIAFPMCGWLIAAKTGITDSAVATSFMNQFSFGGFSWLAVVVLGASYFATNDSNLYAISHIFEGVLKISHKKIVLFSACFCALLSFVLARMGAASALEHICALNSVLIPTATVIISAEWLIIRRRNWYQPAIIQQTSLPALAAFVLGAGAGLVASGAIPGVGTSLGVPPLIAWSLALIVYIPWRLAQISSSKLLPNSVEAVAVRSEPIPLPSRSR
jgi:purine-cytosine permease-like protein